MPPIRTKGSLYILEAPVEKNKECPLAIPIALHTLGSCYVYYKEPSSSSSQYKYGFRWSGVGDLSGVRKVTFHGVHDVLSKMNANRSGVAEFDTSARAFPEGSKLRLEVFAAEGQETKQALAASALHTSTHHPNDVRLFFPRLGRDLWTSSALLSSKSPYFKTVLSSTFAEGVSTTLASMSKAAAEEVNTDAGFEDSDDEADEALPKLASSIKADSSACKRAFHEVIITASRLTTYQAVLQWLNTSHIDFAELSPPPSVDPSASPAPSSHGKTADTLLSQDSASRGLSSPFAVSIRSVFRLAHFLALDDLVSIALDALAEQLTLYNIIHHLFNEVTAAYTEVADVVTAFAARNWTAIKQGATALSVEKDIMVGGKVLDTRVAWNLMKRLT